MTGSKRCHDSISNSMSAGSRKRTSLFIAADGSLTTPSFLLLAAGPLFWTGYHSWGWAALVLCLVMALLASVDEIIHEDDKREIQYNVMNADDVLEEMKKWQDEATSAHKKDDGVADNDDTKNSPSQQSPSSTNKKDPAEPDALVSFDATQARFRMVLLTGLQSLAKKYGQRQHPSAAIDLPLICQEAAYMGLEHCVEDDQVVAAAISLLALVAKKDQVRERILLEADKYGLDRPIQCLQRAMTRAQHFQEPAREQAAAEIQRKGCLLLGALSDGDAQIARLVVQEGGLDAVLAAAAWFRFHNEVANWALWAVFNICYENPFNKLELFRAGGLRVVCMTMKNNSADSLEVARHGMAILFDVLRQPQFDQINDQDEQYVAALRELTVEAPQIQLSALSSGLHEAVVQAMESNCQTMDLMLMGQEILAGTDYQGKIPEYEPAT